MRGESPHIIYEWVVKNVFDVKDVFGVSMCFGALLVVGMVCKCVCCECVSGARWGLVGVVYVLFLSGLGVCV